MEHTGRPARAAVVGGNARTRRLTVTMKFLLDMQEFHGNNDLRKRVHIELTMSSLRRIWNDPRKGDNIDLYWYDFFKGRASERRCGRPSGLVVSRGDAMTGMDSRIVRRPQA